MNFIQSNALFKRALNAIPSQTQTFSKGWTQYPFGSSPIFAKKAKGGYVWDVDGNKFIDWPMALGPLLLGHNYPTITNAIRRQLDNGIAFSLPTQDELLLAERLIQWFPYAERVRFGKNGSDATTGAVRLARAYTGNDIVLCCGYHGWHDWFIGTTTRNIGVPKKVQELTIPFAYNDLESLDSLLKNNSGKVAAIIMEPMGICFPDEGYLESVRNLATQHKVVLIFDECWTGFRIHLQGAYGKFNVEPDISCFGKALGNGVPISAIVGKSEIMDCLDEVFFSFTFGGDMLGIVAANEVLTTLENEPVLEHVHMLGENLIKGINNLLLKYELSSRISLSGYHARSVFNFTNNGAEDLLLKSLFQQESISQGVLAAGWHAPSYSHTQSDVDRTLEVYNDVFNSLSHWIDNNNLSDNLHGRIVQPVYRRP